MSDEFIRGHFFTKFPGGGLEFGEGTKECLVREFKEETGLDVLVEEHLYTTDFFQISAFNHQDQIVSIYYWVSCNNYESLVTTNQPFNFSREIIQDKTACAEAFRWISIHEFSSNTVHLPIDKIVAELVIKAQKKLNNSL